MGARSIPVGPVFSAERPILGPMTSDSTAPLREPTPEYRASLAARMALRAFGDGVRAADWLVQPNDLFAGCSPLFVAKASMFGCARVCQALDQLVPRRPVKPITPSEWQRKTAPRLRRHFFV